MTPAKAAIPKTHRVPPSPPRHQTHDRPLPQEKAVASLLRLALPLSQYFPDRKSRWVVGSEDALVVVEVLLSELEGFFVVACRVVVAGEVVAAYEDVGVVGFEDAFCVVEGLLSELECFFVVACRVVVAGEVVAACEGVGVVGSEDALYVVEVLLSEADGFFVVAC